MEKITETTKNVINQMSDKVANMSMTNKLLLIAIILLAFILYISYNNSNSHSQLNLKLANVEATCANSQLTQIKKEIENKDVKEGFSEFPKLVLYYADWCGHSQNFLPEWDKFVSSNKSNLTVNKIKCENETKECEPIQGFPTVILHVSENKQIEFGNKTNSSEFYKRTADGLNEFLKDNGL